MAETYYKISESKLKQLLEYQLLYIALENADVDQWDKYDEAVKKYTKTVAEHYLPTNNKNKTLKEVVAIIVKQQYKKV